MMMNTCDDMAGVGFATFRLKFVAIGYFPVSYLLKKPTLFKGPFLSRYPRMWALAWT